MHWWDATMRSNNATQMQRWDATMRLFILALSVRLITKNRELNSRSMHLVFQALKVQFLAQTIYMQCTSTFTFTFYFYFIFTLLLLLLLLLHAMYIRFWVCWDKETTRQTTKFWPYMTVSLVISCQKYRICTVYMSCQPYKHTTGHD